jgi:hypothetical protein
VITPGLIYLVKDNDPDKEFHPNCLQGTLKSKKGRLLDLKTKKRITQPQWNLLFPGTGRLLYLVFSGVPVTRSLVLYVCFVDRCLSFCTFFLGHCVVCSSLIYTDSDYS